MNLYLRNRNCQCARCRAHDLMGPAILITLGVLILLSNYYVVPFHVSFPVLFLVMGAVLLVSRTGSTEGHVNPPVYVAAPPPVAVQQPWTTGVTAPPPSANDPNAPQVKP